MKLEVVSVHYDYIPMDIEAPKRFFVTLKWPAPSTLRPGDVVSLTSEGSETRRTIFTVDEPHGYRVSLLPIPSSMPTSGEIGIDLKLDSRHPGEHDWHYGYGRSSVYLEKLLRSSNGVDPRFGAPITRGGFLGSIPLPRGWKR